MQIKHPLREQSFLRWYEDGKERSKKLEGLYKFTGRLNPKQRTWNNNVDIDFGYYYAKGFEVQKSAVRLPDGALKTVGDFIVDIELHPEVIQAIKVSIEASSPEE